MDAPQLWRQGPHLSRPALGTGRFRSPSDEGTVPACPSSFMFWVSPHPRMLGTMPHLCLHSSSCSYIIGAVTKCLAGCGLPAAVRHGFSLAVPSCPSVLA